MKLLAIDGNSIINRAFYGIKLLTTKDGRYTNAVYGFINILNRLKELENPDGIAVAFDLRKPTFRHQKYAEYKAGRHAMPQELATQFDPLKEWLRAMGYKVIECEGYEADDILGTLARLSEESGNECVIATGDKDSLQLISDSVRVLLATTKAGAPEVTNYDKKALFDKYGLTPPQMIELKALMGDSSDNIPGVAGVGEKTATDLITRFGSIDYIYDNIDKIDVKEGVRAKLKNDKENAFFSRWLGTICKEAPIIQEIENYKNNEMDNSKVASIMTSLEFFGLMKKMGIDSSAAAPLSQEETKAFCQACVDKLTGEKIDLLFNFETESFTASDGQNICAVTKEQAFKILEDAKISKRVNDLKNLYKYCTAKGVEIKKVTFDSLLAGYLCNPSSNSYELDRLAAEYGVTVNFEGDEELKKTAIFSLVCDKLQKELETNGQASLLLDIELPLAVVLGSMELEGIAVDSKALKTHGEELSLRIAELEKRVYELVGYEFNLNSPKQLGVALFEKLGLPAKKKTKSGYSTGAEVLEELKDAHPVIAYLLQYRTLAKLKSTYCDSLLSAVAEDGRIHSTFNQTETRTGRISSLEPNLQNIPVRTEEGRVFRKFFIAKEGYTLCDADYSQIELRVLSHMAGDENMINAFNSGEDIHTATAAQVFNMPIDMVTPLMRSRAKAVNFGIVYGIGAFSLAKDIGVTRKEAAEYIDSYLATYPQVDKFMKDTIENAKENGFVTTLFNRRRYLPELFSSNHMLKAFGERVARNAPIQGTAADIIKIAMINVSNRLKSEKLDAKLILQVHDELIIECKEEIKEKVSLLLKEEMEKAATMRVNLTADVSVGSSWYEAKE
ncbi:MAG: DNA polymerase I [Clostridia bacterium]|nr:DNA polymerase I [Clostridia bacterium]